MLLMEEFLEKYPLYQKALLKEGYDLQESHFSVLPAITAFCEQCGDFFTFNPILIDEQEPSKYAHVVNSSRYMVASGSTYRIVYQCKKCNTFHKEFLVRYTIEEKAETDDSDGFYKVFATKVGQYPAYSIDVEEEMKSYLDEKNLSLYRRGVICESQSYGVGSFAYYRQVVENQIDALLDEILGFVEKNQAEELKKKIELAKKEQDTADKINIVKNFLPPSLKPDGNNILKLMYTALSDGLHNKTDDECLQVSQNLRACLVFLVKKVEEQKHDEKVFKNAYKSLQENISSSRTKK